MAVSAEMVGEFKVFEKWEMRWMAEALALKITTERNKLEFLLDTWEIADNDEWHQAQINVQRRILAAHERLLQKVTED